MFGCPGPMLYGWDLEAIMPQLAQKAVDVVESAAAEERPFFLYFSLTGPHTPIVPTAQFRGCSRAGLYGDWVMQMDDAMGQVDAAVRRCGIEDDTLIMVASDNGSPARNGEDASGPLRSVTRDFGHNPSWILRGMKGDVWEGGHRVPFLAKWPRRIPAGTRCDALVCLMDIMATCAAILGQPLPEGAAEDSVSILPHLLGRTTVVSPRREIVHHGLNGLHGFRRHEWKLIDGTGSGGFSPDPEGAADGVSGQLYDLGQDLPEQTNRYADRPDLVERLSAALTDARESATAENGRLIEKGAPCQGPDNCVE